ncbi:MAG: hypothetical protein M3007_02425 [Candidatus Eremiobacteraeota bacterium]|nr:hypothetical protein [Candidatus Eremiobacteraeota bacterium]
MNVQVQNRQRSIIRTVAVLGLALIALGKVTPQIAYYWMPRGDFGIRDGMQSGVTFIVGELAPRSPATEAGLHVRDQIETTRLTLHESNIVCCSFGAKPGESLRLHVAGRGKQRIVTLVARPVHMSTAEIKDNLWDQVTWLLRILLGAGLVLLRPGRLTWLFYIWQAGIGDANPPPDYFLLLPSSLFVLCSLPYVVLGAAVSYAGALFCLVFPNDEPTGWRRRAVPVVFVILCISVAIALALFVASHFKFDIGGSWWLHTIEDVLGGLVGIAALVTYYVTSRGFDRQRVRWVVAVVVIASLGEVFWNLREVVAPGSPPPFYADLYLRWIGLLIVFAFAYAIMRYGMFDVEFILSRGLVYSLLAIAAAGTFIAIDLLFTSRFHGSRAEFAIDIAVALAIGFRVRAIHGRAIDLVDRLLFRRRYQSRALLKAAVDSLNTADSAPAIEKIITSDAASALGLASAVFFRRVADGGLLREIGFGWPAEAQWHVLPDDKLVKLLERNAPRSIDLQSLGWRVDVEPPQQPVVAIPMLPSGRVIGVTFYGSRLNGVLPSPDEIRGLVELVRRATSAYLMFDSMRPAMTARKPATAHLFG